ncbi:hypothetical protein PR048_002488 [Dryococelus australis]|uniref:Uncharacterized protein n=1 Tax=Dryococelus australis TaxID=614101 RepID=A0ABQ9IL27_9NEOP|nr:hypothetical protein PR048_002488 [Dryococelus australis]
MSELTPEHLEPKRKAKMRVKLAAQVFNARVSSAIKTISVVSDGKKLGKCTVTADFLAMVDNFFDVTSGPEGSVHHEMFKEMGSTLTKWKLIHKKDGSTHIPPCVSGWIDNVKVIQKLWSVVQELGNKQDPLENLFAIVRQSCGCNRDPTCVQFVAAMKITLVNKLSASNINCKNCVDDEDTHLLSENRHFAYPRKRVHIS